MFKSKIVLLSIAFSLGLGFCAQADQQQSQMRMLRVLVSCDKSGMIAAKQMMSLTILGISAWMNSSDPSNIDGKQFVKEFNGLQSKALLVKSCDDVKRLYLETKVVGQLVGIDFDQLYVQEKEKKELKDLAADIISKIRNRKT